jgi:hypothetical protein
MRGMLGLLLEISFGQPLTTHFNTDCMALEIDTVEQPLVISVSISISKIDMVEQYLKSSSGCDYIA